MALLLFFNCHMQSPFFQRSLLCKLLFCGDVIRIILRKFSVSVLLLRKYLLMIRKLFSYFIPINVYRKKSAGSKSLEVTWNNGELVLDSRSTNSLLNLNGFILFNTMVINKTQEDRNLIYKSKFGGDYSLRMYPKVKIHNELFTIKKLS